MGSDDKEQERLRATALKNAESILIARQRAERQLVAANEALERKTEELLEQRTWFEVTLSSIGDAVIATDTHGDVTFLNPVAEKMTGWTRAEAIAKPLGQVFRIVNEITGQPLENPVNKVLQTGRVVGLANDTVLIGRNGSSAYIEDSAAPIRDAHGNLSGVVMVFHDVSERRRADEKRRSSEERLRATFDQAAVGIAVAGLDERFLEANQKFSDILGYSLEELRGLSFRQITHPEDLAQTSTHVRRLLDGEISHYVLEKRYVRKDATFVWTRTTVTLLKKASGEAEQFIGLVEDITDRKRLDEAVLQSIAERKNAEEVRARLAAVVEFSQDAIISKTLEGVIATWNRAAEQMFGYSAAEVIGKSITILIPSDQFDEEPAILDRLKRGEPIEHYDTVRVRKDGTRLNVSLSVSPIRDIDGTIVGASKIARDVTQQKRAEAALRDTDRRKDEFLATLAHELRNPLAPIRQAALISKSPAASEAQKRWSHEVINRQVHHMAMLLDDLLDISRITRGALELRKELTQLAAVVDAAVETVRPAIDLKRHELTIELPEQPIRFMGDPLRLAQVLSNLLTNAAKYTDPDGQIRLRASVVDRVLSIRVTDTGIGIHKDTIGSLFEMFSQVKSSQHRSDGGLGIGLALAKGLAELHGGTIDAHSDGIGRGSEFVVRLPLEDGIAPRPVEPAISGDSNTRRRRVLIADDNRDAADSLAVLLRMEGHQVTVVHDGQAALSALLSERPELALLDIGMPHLNGYEVARKVRQGPLGGTVRLVAITGWGQDSDKAKALDAGFDHHFTKPIEPDRLSDLLRDS